MKKIISLILLKGRKNEWCTYRLTEYAEESWFKKWKK